MSQRLHESFSGLMNTFHQHGNRIAVTDKNGIKYSYAIFYKHIAWARIELQKKNVKKGTKVLLAIPMSMELYVTMEALFSLGAVIIFLDPWMNGKQMSKIIRKVKPELLITTPKIRFFAYFSLAAWQIKKWWSFAKLKTSDVKWEPISVIDSDQALVTFTSGTSGEPKGADRDFGFLAAQIEALKPHMNTESNEIFIDYTNFPIVGLADFAMGNHVVIPNINLMKIHEANTEDIRISLEKEKVNRIVVSPSLLSRVYMLLTESKSTFNLKYVITGGAPIPFSLIRNFNTNFSNLHSEAIYGSTEAEPIAIASFSEVEENMSDPLLGVYTGKPIDNIQIKIVKATNQCLTNHDLKNNLCADLEIGEVIVCGDHVNKKYYENDLAFKENKIVDDGGSIWHRTGDIGYFKDRKLFLTSRLHRIVKRDNQEFYPFPIEFYLEQVLKIADCGYVQNSSAEIILFIGDEVTVSDSEIKTHFQKLNYPLDSIKRLNEKLPRDPRHKSKLDINKLLN